MSVTKSEKYGLLEKFLGLILFTSGLATAATAQADNPPPPPGPGPLMTMHVGPGGDAMYFGVGEGKQVKGLPMSGSFVVTRDTTLSDGTHIHNVTQTKIYRDAEGRVRREIGIDLNMPSTGAVKHTMIMIIDPVGGYRYMLNPENKTARQLALHAPGHSARGAAEGPGAPGDEPKFFARFKDSVAVNTEELGTRAINGVQAQGTRVTRTIPAGEIGNDKPIQVVTERWVAVDLQVALLVKHSDPLMGVVTSELTNIARGDQDAALFQVPSDYKLESGKPNEPFYVPMQH